MRHCTVFSRYNLVRCSVSRIAESDSAEIGTSPVLSSKFAARHIMENRNPIQEIDFELGLSQNSAYYKGVNE